MVNGDTGEGGVLKLETVYRNYKIRAVINQYRELSAVLKVYRDRHGYWPVDEVECLLI